MEDPLLTKSQLLFFAGRQTRRINPHTIICRIQIG